MTRPWCRPDRSRGRPRRHRHRRRGLRHGRLLRGRECATRPGRRTADHDGTGVAPWTTLESARSRDHSRGSARAAPMQEGLGLPSAGPRGKRFLPLQVHHRRWPSCPKWWWPGGRGEPGVPCPQPGDRAWQTRVVSASVGDEHGWAHNAPQCEPCTNAPWRDRQRQGRARVSCRSPSPSRRRTGRSVAGTNLDARSPATQVRGRVHP